MSKNKQIGILVGVNFVLSLLYFIFTLLKVESTCVPFRCDGGANDCRCTVLGSNILYEVSTPWIILSVLTLLIYVVVLLVKKFTNKK